VGFEKYSDHVALKLWVTYPLEFLEGYEFGKRSLEYSWRWKVRNMVAKAIKMILTRHNLEHVTIVVCPMNAESLYSAREEWVYLDSVKDIECPVPAVWFFAEVKIDSAENTTEGNVTMEGWDKEPGAEEVPRDKARDLVPNFWRNTLRGGDSWEVDLIEGELKVVLWKNEDGRTNDGLPTQVELKLSIKRVERRSRLKVCVAMYAKQKEVRMASTGQIVENDANGVALTVRCHQ
jgi:hypothetical protein